MLKDEDRDIIWETIKHDPTYYREKILGSGRLWSGQEEIYQAYTKAVRGEGKRKITIKGGKNLGKTYALAEITLHFLYSEPESLVLTTAPSTRQVKNLLWGEIQNHYLNATYKLGGELVTMTLKPNPKEYPKWMAFGFSTDKPVNASGWHGARVLLIVDETQGVDDAILDELDGAISGEDCILIYSGNPVSPDGRFYESFKDPEFEKITLNCLDHPNFRQRKESYRGMVSYGWVKDREKRWGVNSPLYTANVLGEFPESASMYPITILDIQKATERVCEPNEGDLKEGGLDIADGGTDENVFTIRRGPKVLKQEWWWLKSGETMGTVGKAVNLCKEYELDRLKVDAIGVGAGVYSRLKELEGNGELKTKIVPVLNSAKANNPEQFLNIRVESWLGLAQRFKDGDIDMSLLKDNEELKSQLTRCKEMPVNSRGQRILQSKSDMKDAGFSSPDRADSLVLAFYNPPNEQEIRITTF